MNPQGAKADLTRPLQDRGASVRCSIRNDDFVVRLRAVRRRRTVPETREQTGQGDNTCHKSPRHRFASSWFPPLTVPWTLDATPFMSPCRQGDVVSL